MTEQHVAYIQTSLGKILGTIPGWFKKATIRAEAVANLAERGLTDLNRLADAAEKLAGKYAGEITATVTADTAGIKEAVDNLATRATDIEKQAVSDYAAWLTTRPGVLKAGAGLEAPPVFDTIAEYGKIKGWQS